ncbi:uncharacterized protein VTP21DRAFT_9879 [Calcarisporiella thermophila]|uniref:uncharacterized protein n=1 Tax=Calcarisporiella thermophila TaxID=911321 RepID=UPI0037420DCF
MAGGPAGGFHPHLPGAGYRWTAKLIGASMWFFMMYRAKQDMPHILGWHHPWDHHGHGNHGHDEKEHH